jgi:ketosteroid isomerase-like protein
MTPREVFETMREQWVAGRPGIREDIWGEDLVVEVPFAAPGRHKRVEGREEWRAVLAEIASATLPVTFEECNTIAIHDTHDPGTIVVEYELVATSNATGKRDSAQFIGVLKVRDGKGVFWREYQDTMKLTAAGF